jgi:hypothetical protein
VALFNDFHEANLPIHHLKFGFITLLPKGLEANQNLYAKFKFTQFLQTYVLIF